MTKKEIELIEMLKTFWDEYEKLPQQHPCDQQEMCNAIHIAQHLIMIRETRRKHPNIFPIYTDIDVEVSSLENMEKEVSDAVNKTINNVLNED